MSHPYKHIIEEIQTNRICAMEPFRGKILHGIALSNGQKYWFIPKKEWWDDFVNDLFHSSATLVCFDMRRMMDFPINNSQIVDIKTILGGGEITLVARAKQHFQNSPMTAKLADMEMMMSANLRAVKTAQVDIGTNLDKTMTGDFFNEYLKSRVTAIKYLYDKFSTSRELDDWWRRLDFIEALHEVEQNGICIDKSFVDSQLLRNNEVATAKSLRSMQSLYRNGFVTALFNASGTKTGRLRPEGGFGAMGIPHGEARKAIISRFPDGKIYSFDYNAIDYRSIVSTIGGQFAELYKDSKDFHTRTAQFIFNEVDSVRRDALKAISYTSIYGGSEETLVSRTGLSLEVIRIVLDKLKDPLRPISEFREKLWGEWQMFGYIDIPGVGRYEKKDDEDMHPGKLLALYAQGYSAYVFERAFVNVHTLLKSARGSCIIFPVHDELVIDVHPDDELAGAAFQISNQMQSGVAEGFIVNYKKGRSYGEVE